MFRLFRLVWVSGLCCAVLSDAGAAERRLRPLTTDRPDATESPITVDAGHFQVETSLVEYSHTREKGRRERTWAVLPTNIKYGVSDRVDVQLVVTPHMRTRTRVGGQRDRVQGFGTDTQLRLKVNVWGNDGPDPVFGESAFAVMPFVKFPSGPKRSRGSHVEGGVIAPLALALPGEFSLGVMAELDVVYDEDRRRYGLDFVHSATLGHAVFGRLSGYIEYMGTAARAGRYQPVASSGLTYALSSNSSIDVGARCRLSRSVRDVTAFAGLSRRF